jgi:hypothetical protein
LFGWPEFLAGATFSMTVLPHDQVCADERVTTDAFCAPSLQRRRSNPPQDVHAVGDGFKVIHADTSIVTADVIQFGSAWDLSTKQHPDPDMCRTPFPVQHRLGVAVFATCEPACGHIARSPEVDLVEQALRQVLIGGWEHQPKGTNACG